MGDDFDRFRIKGVTDPCYPSEGGCGGRETHVMTLDKLTGKREGGTISKHSEDCDLL